MNVLTYDPTWRYKNIIYVSTVVFSRSGFNVLLSKIWGSD